MSVPQNQAVFLSYASQDVEAAQRLAEALRAAGVEVWFDQNELVGGDAWDAKIRRQIAECALFVPIISANTQARTEGYFRLEWKLAAQRTHMIADDAAFLLPVVIDDTRDSDARVPTEFKAVQWTRVPGGDTPPAFSARVRKLLDPGAGADASPRGTPLPATKTAGRTARRLGYGWAAAAIGLGLAMFYVLRPRWQELQTKPESPPAATALTETQRLVRQAKALIDEEPLAVRETFRTAYELAEKAASLSPNDAEAWAVMARASAALAELYSENENTRIAAARSQAQRALQLAPDSLEAGLAAATVELSLLKAEPAAIRTLLEGLLRRAPRDYRILILLAKTEGMNSDTPDALRWLADAEAAPGGKARSLLRQAWHYWGANRLRESLAAVERSLAAQPLTEAYNLKLMLLTVIGDSEGARQWLKRIPPMILREDRPAVIAYEALYYAHQPDEALRVVQAVPREILEEGRYFNVRALLAGEALLMAGKPRAAEIEFRAALKVIDERLAANPRHSRLWHERGQAQLYLGDRAAAEQSFITASELGGLSVTALAVQTQLLGKTEETLALIDRALQRTASRWPSALRRFKIHPVFAPLRENPRFQQLIARAESWLAEELQTAAAPPAVTASPFATPVKPDDKSIAVLAFANLSDDKANEYFSDGISEELLNVLAKVPGLKVPARTSAFSFKGKNTPVPEIAKQLGVAYVVDGSVRKAGEKVRITAQLIQAADGFHVWSDTFTRDLKDIFAVQDEIAGRIAAELSLKLGVTTAAAKTAVNPDAFELYVQARQAWNLRTPAGLEQAERLLHRALKLEPKWARAHAALADVWLSQAIERRKIGSFGQRHSPEFARLRAQVDRALALDPDLAEARATLGNLLQLSAQFEAGERELRRAVTLNPNYASGHQWLGRVLQSTARFDEAREALARAAALDPLSPRILDNYAALLQDVGRDAEAMALVERALVLQPDALQATMWKIMGLSTLGRHDEAVALLRRHPFDGTTYVAEALRVLVRAGLKAEAEQMLERNPDTDRFRALAAVGRPQDALDAVQLDRINILTFSLGFIDPDYDSLRQDPRYVSLLAQLGMTEAHARARTWRAAHPLPATPPQP